SRGLAGARADSRSSDYLHIRRVQPIGMGLGKTEPSGPATFSAAPPTLSIELSVHLLNQGPLSPLARVGERRTNPESVPALLWRRSSMSPLATRLVCVLAILAFVFP